MPLAGEDALLGIIDRIYQSVEQPDIWPDLLSEIGELLGGRRELWGMETEVNARAVAFGIGCLPVMFLSRADLAVLQEYEEDFGELISRFLKLVFLSTLWPQGDVAAREALGLRMIRRYPQAFEASDASSGTSPFRIAWRKLMIDLWQNGNVFSRDSLRRMRLLLPHLDRAVRLQTQLRAADLRLEMASGALEQLALGVLLVGPTGQTLWCNRRAREIIATADARRLDARELVTANPRNAPSLQALIADSVSHGRQGFLAIDRGVEARPLLLIAVPLTQHATMAAGLQPAWGVVFISDPDRSEVLSPDPLRRAFGLTPREAQLAIAVAGGNGLQAAANALGVAATTARSQLQQVFAKTNTRQQAELAALVHRTLGLLRQN